MLLMYSTWTYMHGSSPCSPMLSPPIFYCKHFSYFDPQAIRASILYHGLSWPFSHIYSECWHPTHGSPFFTLILNTEILWKSRLTKSNVHFSDFTYSTSWIMHSHWKTKTPISPDPFSVGGVVWVVINC